MVSPCVDGRIHLCVNTCTQYTRLGITTFLFCHSVSPANDACTCLHACYNVNTLSRDIRPAVKMLDVGGRGEKKNKEIKQRKICKDDIGPHVGKYRIRDGRAGSELIISWRKRFLRLWQTVRYIYRIKY